MKPEGPATMPWEDQIFADGAQLRPSAFHLAMTTQLTDAQVLRLAREAGFRAVSCDRGGVFGLVEVWPDNVLLLEVLSRPDVDRYRRVMNTDGVAQMFGQGLRPAAV